ncbi:MAG: Flp pilus assembly complex ATPase component TadA [Planctomycetes bacterium]|nr:Flp pilus assembly complex ATPase component TadA [Planctomycetota bacterium]MCB9909198.1 Flp pilus assembly complex ATPase component TadA [Planctomycetota bacterium]MCB9913320.1 Flp pilus assembly complex ATPase component TadA [Planctomycetota bacterium]HPF14842.1 ATPase, T2SS/T4P/T4SS family [Planctomycetota bacterium]
MVSIGDLLVDAGLARHHLEDCRLQAAASGESVDRIILQRGFLDEATLLQVYAKHLGYEFRASLEGTKVPAKFVDSIPVQFVRNYNLIPLAQGEDRVVKVATCSPLDPHPMDDLSAMLGCEVDAVLAPRLEITGLISRAYRHKADGIDEALDAVAEDGDIGSMAAQIDEAEDVLNVSNKAPIIKLVNTVLFQALKMRASDVHFQPYAERMQVRFRIDGILYDMDSIPRRVQDAIISRVKVMGKMDIAERRLPQDGRATIRLGDGEVDVRISTIPTSDGERIVLRLLDKSAKLYTLDEIGLTKENQDLMREYLDFNHGIILVTGPTGSGKTTTLYASMAQIDTSQKNVLTIEDPVEYALPGVSQVQVNVKKGLTFATGLRSFLRQDPDVMMVGEIRDLETAEVAIRAALTGHLVFSTVHTNDAASTITRMVDQGVEPYLVSSSIVLIIAQRLVRTICRHCRHHIPITDEWKAKLDKVGMDLKRLNGKVAVGAGCEECFHSGYSGRTAIYEIMPVDEELRTQIMTGASASEMKRSAVTRGLITLREDGRQKIEAGLTTADEVLRVTQLDFE